MQGRIDALCLDERRKEFVREHPTLNGIDFVEYGEDRTVTPPRFWLAVTFLKNAPALAPEDAAIEGGTRIVGVHVTGVGPGAGPKQAILFVNEPGDFGDYTLILHEASLDLRLSAAIVRFRANCPSEFDCRQEVECPPTLLEEPLLDYLAKDYASFRRLLLDLIPLRNPGWIERNPADLGMALVELLAYAGDHLSYFQDAVATEAYLDTCRHRVSAKRHARLVDYRMHDGRNAWGFVQVDVSSVGLVPRETMLLTRVTRILRTFPPDPPNSAPPPVLIPRDRLDFDNDPALVDVVVFETTADLAAEPTRNRLTLHTWGDRDCCLPTGATGLTLYGLNAAGQRAIRPPLQAGDYLLLEEVKGPKTGLPADADPAHRQAVRLVSVEAAEDPVFMNTIVNGEPERVPNPPPASFTVLPLWKVTWREEDALTFPLCLSTEQPETGRIAGVSIARGNVVPCDHGRTVTEALDLPVASGGRPELMETRLRRAPLAFQAMPAAPTFDSQGRLLQDRHALGVSAREAQPAVVLLMQLSSAEIEIWQPVPDLMDSHAFDRHFVADVDSDLRTTVRFGDDEYGRAPLGAQSVTARYRVGNGRAGNLGGESLAHIVRPAILGSFPTVTGVYQPLPAEGGADPESIEEVRQLAPRAFQAEQFRAVTESDYERAALKLRAVLAAKCAFRWTGSWHTVFVGIHPRDPADLITEAGGRTRLTDALAQAVRAHLTRYKLAGYDMEIRTAQYVPLEITIQVCIARGHFRGEVLEAVYNALSGRLFPDGSTGFFHPSRFAFGQSVYLSRLYAAIEQVEGVDSAFITVFKRYWEVANKELENGVIPMGDWEIARLDNDPNFPENGVLRLAAIGGL